MIRKLTRYILYRLKKYKIGYGSKIYKSIVSEKNWLGTDVMLHNVSLEDYTYISDGTRIRDCTIGKFCSIGRNVKIGLAVHPNDYISTSPFLYRKNFLGIDGFAFDDLFIERDYKKSVIENDVWIGDNVIICGGVKISNGVIIGAGAVVTCDLEEYGIYAGVPAKLIRKRINAHHNQLNKGDIIWWELDDAKIRELVRDIYE